MFKNIHLKHISFINLKSYIIIVLHYFESIKINKYK